MFLRANTPGSVVYMYAPSVKKGKEGRHRVTGVGNVIGGDSGLEGNLPLGTI